MSYKRKHLHLFSAFLFLTAAVTGCGVDPEKEKELVAEKKQMEKYLETKYNQDFVIKKIKSTNAYLGAPEEYAAEASPRGDSTVTFHIGRPVGKTDGYGKGKSYYENYLSVYWTNLFRRKTEAHLRQVYGETPVFQVGVWVPDTVRDQVNKKIPLNKAFVLYGKEVGAEVNYISFQSLENEEDKQKAAAQIFQTIVYLKLNKIQRAEVFVKYLDPSVEKEVHAYEEEYLSSGSEKFWELKRQNLLKRNVSIGEEAVRQIEKPEDILPFLSNEQSQ